MAKALTGEEEAENPTYQQFKDEKIKEQQTANVYYVNDKKRDLSQLESFKSLVDWHYNLDENGSLKIGNTLEESIVSPEPEQNQEEKQAQSEQIVQASAKSQTVQPKETSTSNSNQQQSTVATYTLYGSSYNYNSSSDYTTNNESINTWEEVAIPEGEYVDYEPAEELDNFQVEEVGDQTIISYDEESEEQNNQEQSQPATDENTSTSDTSSETTTEETAEETMPEDYTVTQMPGSNTYILEYEEPVSETPEMTNEEKAEAMVQDMAENPENYTEQATNSESNEFVYQR